MRTMVRLVPALLLALPAAVTAEDAQSILRTMGEKQIARWNGVNSYVVDQTVMGNRITQTYEKFEIQGADGKTSPAFRLARQRSGSGECASFLDNSAMGAEMLGEAHASEVERQMQQAGLPPGLLQATGSDPWATMDSRAMMGGVADFARAGAEAERNRSDGREAFHLVADGLNRTQQADGQEFTLNTINLWVETREYVPLRMKIDGVAKSGSETRPVTIEKFDRDHRTVPGSTMYESYRQVMRLSGMLDAAQRAEMADAQKQMAEMEKQLEQMPPAQRQMVMQQMGPQMAMMKQMASGGGFATTTEVQQIVVNPPAAPAGQAGGPCAPAADLADAARDLGLTEDEIAECGS